MLASTHGQHLDHNNVFGVWTNVLLTTKQFAHIGSLGGTSVNSPHCRRMPRALENRAQIADYPSRTATRPHAASQTRLSALRRKLFLNKQLAENRWESYGHLGDYSEDHLHARHRLMTFSWQLREWTRQSAAARRTSQDSELHRALKDGRSHEIHRLTQLLGEKGTGRVPNKKR